MVDDANIDRRTRMRVKTNIPAQYFIKNQSMRYESCFIVDVSRTGIGIRFPKFEKITLGGIVFIEITLPKSFEQINLQGEIRRIQKTGGELTGGIKFKSILHEDMFNKLILQ